jgi:hypothetical protein
MVGEDRDWSAALREFRQQLTQFRQKVKNVERGLKKALDAPDDHNAAHGFLRALEGLSGQSAPQLRGYEEWLQYWRGRSQRAELEFASRFREQLKTLEKEIQEETGEEWRLELSGSYPSYTIGDLITVKVERGDSRDLGRLTKRVGKQIRQVVRRRFQESEFLGGLRTAYYMARAADEASGGTTRVDQELRRLHRLMPLALEEAGVRGVMRGSYPLEAFGVDLGRCLAAGRLDVGGEVLKLVQTKYGSAGVRVVHPGLPGVRVFGKARFEKGGEAHGHSQGGGKATAESV